MQQRGPTAQGRHQPQPDGRDQGDGDDVGRDPAGVVGEADDLRRCRIRDEDDHEVAGDDEPVDPPPEDRAQDAERDDRPHRPGDEQAQGQGVDPAGADQLGLVGDGDEGGLGHHRGRAESEAEGEQRHQGPSLGELGCQAPPEGEDAEVQTLEEDRDAQRDDEHPHDERAQVRRDLADDQHLEGEDHGEDRRQAGQGVPQPDQQVACVVAHAVSLDGGSSLPRGLGA